MQLFIKLYLWYQSYAGLYVAPEVYNDEIFDRSVDAFSFGLILYEVMDFYSWQNWTHPCVQCLRLSLTSPRTTWCCYNSSQNWCCWFARRTCFRLCYSSMIFVWFSELIMRAYGAWHLPQIYMMMTSGHHHWNVNHLLAHWHRWLKEFSLSLPVLQKRQPKWYV